MISLTSGELLAMRAVIEVGEPSADDAGPMEIWTTAMGAMKKIEDEVGLKNAHEFVNTKLIEEVPKINLISATTPNISILHPDANLHTCTVGDRLAIGEVCGKPAVAKYDDGLHNVEYFCKDHEAWAVTNMSDSELDCGWSKL